MNNIMPFLGLLYIGWVGFFFYHVACYCYGDKTLALNLIDNLSKNPSQSKKNVSLQIGAAGGFLIIYSFIYPFCRHRRKNKSLSFDLFMWSNWLLSMSFIFFSYLGRTLGTTL